MMVAGKVVIDGDDGADEDAAGDRAGGERFGDRAEGDQADEHDDGGPDDEGACCAGDGAGALLGGRVGVPGGDGLADALAQVPGQEIRADHDAQCAERAGQLTGDHGQLMEDATGPSGEAVAGQDREQQQDDAGRFIGQPALASAPGAPGDVAGQQDVDEVEWHVRCCLGLR